MSSTSFITPEHVYFNAYLERGDFCRTLITPEHLFVVKDGKPYFVIPHSDKCFTSLRNTVNGGVVDPLYANDGRCGFIYTAEGDIRDTYINEDPETHVYTLRWFLVPKPFPYLVRSENIIEVCEVQALFEYNPDVDRILSVLDLYTNVNTGNLVRVRHEDIFALLNSETADPTSIKFESVFQKPAVVRLKRKVKK